MLAKKNNINTQAIILFNILSMRAQMYCIKHIELNADMEKNIIS